jgi:glucosamine-6-phosphate deaminase
MNPASALQMHANAKIFLDEAAAAKLKKADYYRWVYDHKPEWQQF